MSDTCEHGKRLDQCTECYHEFKKIGKILPGRHPNCDRLFKDCRCDLSEDLQRTMEKLLHKNIEKKRQENDEDYISFLSTLHKRLTTKSSQKSNPLQATKNIKKWLKRMYMQIIVHDDEFTKFELEDRLDLCLQLGLITRREYADSWTRILQESKHEEAVTKRKFDDMVLNNAQVSTKAVTKRKLGDINLNNAHVSTKAVTKRKFDDMDSNNAADSAAVDKKVKADNWSGDSCDSKVLKIFDEEFQKCKDKMQHEFYSELYGQFGAKKIDLLVEIANNNLNNMKNSIEKRFGSLVGNLKSSEESNCKASAGKTENGMSASEGVTKSDHSNEMSEFDDVDSEDLRDHDNKSSTTKGEAASEDGNESSTSEGGRSSSSNRVVGFMDDKELSICEDEAALEDGNESSTSEDEAALEDGNESSTSEGGDTLEDFNNQVDKILSQCKLKLKSCRDKWASAWEPVARENPNYEMQKIYKIFCRINDRAYNFYKENLCAIKNFHQAKIQSFDNSEKKTNAIKNFNGDVTDIADVCALIAKTTEFNELFDLLENYNAMTDLSTMAWSFNNALKQCNESISTCKTKIMLKMRQKSGADNSEIPSEVLNEVRRVDEIGNEIITNLKEMIELVSKKMGQLLKSINNDNKDNDLSVSNELSTCDGQTTSEDSNQISTSEIDIASEDASVMKISDVMLSVLNDFNRNLDKHLTQSQKNANTRYETFERALKRFRGDDNESDFQCLSKIGQAICLSYCRHFGNFKTDKKNKIDSLQKKTFEPVFGAGVCADACVVDLATIAKQLKFDKLFSYRCISTEMSREFELLINGLRTELQNCKRHISSCNTTCNEKMRQELSEDNDVDGIVTDISFNFDAMKQSIEEKCAEVLESIQKS